MASQVLGNLKGFKAFKAAVDAASEVEAFRFVLVACVVLLDLQASIRAYNHGWNLTHQGQFFGCMTHAVGVAPQ
jgi:hypothetical protein